MNLHDDEIEIQYMPSMVTNSRSASMKKLAKKPQPKPAPIVTKKSQFDYDELDELLASPAKIPTSKPTQKAKPSNVAKTKVNDDIDSFFDQPTLPIASKNVQKTTKIETNTNTNMRPSTANNISSSLNMAQDNILEQHDSKPSSSFKFKRPQTAINVNKPPVVQQQAEITISPSTRMMKPPLRKRQSQKPKQEIAKSVSGVGLGLVLQEQPKKVTTNSTNIQQNTNKFKVPQNVKRRSSIEMSTDQFNLSLDDDQAKNKNQSKSTNQFQFNKNTNANANINNHVHFQKPKQQKQQFSYETKKLQLFPQTKKQEKKEIKKQQKRPYWQTQKSMTINQTTSAKYNINTQITPPTIINNNTGVSQVDIQKQIQFIKRNYQKHIDTLQKNLQQQIKINKDTRQRLMRQTNTMIQNQRQRMKKIHDQQIQRIKHMNQWQKKKIQQNYTSQIQLLKSQIQNNSYKSKHDVMQNYNMKYNSYGTDRKQLQYLQQKLRSQRKMLEQKNKILDRRQIDIEERQREFNNRKRNQQEKLRNQQRKIFQYEVDAKKMILNQKRMLEEQKQSLATQLATLEIGNYKRQQNIQQLKNQLQSQKQMIARQRMQTKNLSNNLTLQYQKKVAQLKIQKQRVVKLQSELVNKIKIVEGTRQRFTTANPTTKQNNWINISMNQQQTSQLNKNTMSIDKINQKKKLDNTQTRFMEMAASLKDSIKGDKKRKDFDLDNYLMSMAHYTRAREQVH